MKIGLIIIASLFSFNIFAKDGSSGCGPGWYVFKKNSIVSSLLRATTNGLLAPTVTLGMTFGTSNCSKHSIVKTEQRTLHYITHNLYEVKSDSAKGQGDFVTAFGKVIGCQEKDLNYFNKGLQQNYETIFKDDASHEDILKETYRLILSDPILLKSCSLS